VVAGAFVVRAISDQWTMVRSSLADARPAWLVAALLCAAAGMVTVAFPWRTALTILGATADRASIVAWYFMGEVGKYLPGGVWPVVGRGELAYRGGISRAAAYASVALSLGALYLAAMLMVVVLLPLRVAGDHGAEALWVLLLLPAGLAALHPRPLGWLVGRAEKLLRRELAIDVPPWSATMGLVARYLPSWLLIGTATWCVARAFDPDARWLAVAPAAIVSWIVGFVSVGVPGGIGVREAVFVAAAGTIPTGARATVAVAARLCFILVDAGGAALSAMAWRRWPPRVQPTEERPTDERPTDERPIDERPIEPR
jgi:uncharacterized membrane protein YbhN (UPF0104 family)